MTAAATTPNFAQTRAAITGNVKFAPLGTAVPTDVVSQWAAGWVDLGTIDDKGVSDDPKLSFTGVKAWQSPMPVRQLPESAEPTIKLNAIQLNWATMQAYSGAVPSLVSAGLYKVSIPPYIVTTEWMLGIEFKDGTLTYRKWFNRGMFTDPGAMTYARNAPVTTDLTYTIMPIDPSTTDLATWLTNDANFASS